MDIGTFAETNEQGTRNEIQGKYVHFYIGVERMKRAKAGVSFIIHRIWKNILKNWNEVKERKGNEDGNGGVVPHSNNCIRVWSY